MAVTMQKCFFFFSRSLFSSPQPPDPFDPSDRIGRKLGHWKSRSSRRPVVGSSSSAGPMYHSLRNGWHQWGVTLFFFYTPALSFWFPFATTQQGVPSKGDKANQYRDAESASYIFSWTECAGFLVSLTLRRAILQSSPKNRCFSPAWLSKLPPMSVSTPSLCTAASHSFFSSGRGREGLQLGSWPPMQSS